MIMITVSLVMSIVFAEVAVSIAIRAVIVFNAAAVSLPVSGVISFAIAARRDPTRSLIRWPSPVSFVLLVVPANRIPITRHPHGLRSWAWGGQRQPLAVAAVPQSRFRQKSGFTCASSDEQRRDQPCPD